MRMTMLVLLVILAGCSSKETISVSEQEYGSRWPLVIHEAELGCRDGKIAYLKFAGSAGIDTYLALNGNAIRAGLPKIDAVKKPMYANTVGAADFTERAMTLCR